LRFNTIVWKIWEDESLQVLLYEWSKNFLRDKKNLHFSLGCFWLNGEEN
jgi:hypothetical protein